jgi:uncharacterized transporter YbjL
MFRRLLYMFLDLFFLLMLLGPLRFALGLVHSFVASFNVRFLSLSRLNSIRSLPILTFLLRGFLFLVTGGLFRGRGLFGALRAFGARLLQLLVLLLLGISHLCWKLVHKLSL